MAERFKLIILTLALLFLPQMALGMFERDYENALKLKSYEEGITRAEPTTTKRKALASLYGLLAFVGGSAFSLYLLKLVLRKGEAKTTASEIRTAILWRIKQAFHSEGAWRLFLVLQPAGIAAIIYVDLHDNNWDFLPRLFDYGNHFELEWDFLESYFWTHKNENWIAFLGVFGPAIIAKSVGWIRSANDR